MLYIGHSWYSNWNPSQSAASLLVWSHVVVGMGLLRLVKTRGLRDLELRTWVSIGFQGDLNPVRPEGFRYLYYTAGSQSNHCLY